MTPQPTCHSTDLTPAFALRYSWCGWTTAGDLRSMSSESWAALDAAWENDGLKLLERAIENDKVLLTTDGRTRIVDEQGLSTIRDGASRISKKKGYRIESHRCR